MESSLRRSRYETWYEFKRDLQSKAGRAILNEEWLQKRPREPLPWDDSAMQRTLLKLGISTSVRVGRGN